MGSPSELPKPSGSGDGRPTADARRLPRLPDFKAVAVRSGLLDERTIRAAWAELTAPDQAAPDAAIRLARHLIARQELTTYQARKLLSGVSRGFFLAGYKILRQLGEGGMGKVYLAENQSDGTRVALKVLPPKKAIESEQALLRFQREMDLSQRVVHPNLARTLQAGEFDGIYYMVMEYVPGDSLYNIVRNPQGGPLRVPDAARYFMKVLDGLAAAHAAHLVHRDLKPSNLMILPNSDAKILDLGLARAVGEENPLTRPNTVLGTLDYASPEQLSDASQADHRSDLYSLGCTLYFALSGRAPFEGGDVVNKIYKQRMEDPEPLEQVTRGVPAAFSAIVKKLMAKEPGDRYQSTRELMTDLARWVDPARVRAILGEEAEAARAFKPPPMELQDDELRLLDSLDSVTAAPSHISLRELGESEPAAAPRTLPPTPPRSAVVMPSLPRNHPQSRHVDDDNGWLVRFVVLICLLGVVAIVLLILLR